MGACELWNDSELYKCIPFNHVFVLLVSQEVFYLTYTPDDVEGNVHLETGDKVSFYMETNKQ